MNPFFSLISGSVRAYAEPGTVLGPGDVVMTVTESVTTKH